MNTDPPLIGLGLVPLLAPGLALLVAVRLVFDRRGGDRRETLRLILTTIGVLFLVLAILGALISITGPFVIAVVIALGVVVLMAFLRLRRTCRAGLLTALAVAVQHGVPLDRAMRAFAEEHAGAIGFRASRAADLLHAGASLHEALQQARYRLPGNVMLAISLAKGDQLAPTLRRCTRDQSRFEHLLRPIAVRCFIVALLVVIPILLLTGMMYFIVPVFIEMYADFELELPRAFVVMVGVSQAVVDYYWLIVPLVILPAMTVLVLALVYYVGILPESLPLLGRLWWPADRAGMLRGLARAVAGGASLNSALETMAGVHPRAYFRRRLLGARRHLEQGVPWCEALRRQRLIGRGDAALLTAAERVGNLSWALEESADACLRRAAMRVQAVLGSLTPIVIVIIGAMLGFLVIAMMFPLVNLVLNLA